MGHKSPSVGMDASDSELSKSDSCAGHVWEALGEANRALELIDQAKRYSSISNEELEQVAHTLQKSKECLVAFAAQQPNDVAFDICFGNTKHTLSTIRAQLDLITPHCTMLDHTLLRNEYLLSFRVDQLQTLFHPCGSVEQKFYDRGAESLWRNSFGQVNLVPWNNFWKVLKGFLGISPSVNPAKICNFLDITRSGFVTWHELNLFLRWFGTLSECVNRLLRLLDRGILAGFISAEEATWYLKDRSPGTYLVRFSKSEITSFALAYVNDGGVVQHALLKTIPPHTLSVGPATFDNLEDFLEKQKHKLRTPGQYCWLGALEDDQSPQKQRMDTVYTPAPEESSVEEKEESRCIICMDRPQEVIFLECGHLCCCRGCSLRIQNQCPVCRQFISRIIPVYKI